MMPAKLLGGTKGLLRSGTVPLRSRGLDAISGQLLGEGEGLEIPAGGDGGDYRGVVRGSAGRHH
jgi:hypothetical protein